MEPRQVRRKGSLRFRQWGSKGAGSGSWGAWRAARRLCLIKSTVDVAKGRTRQGQLRAESLRRSKRMRRPAGGFHRVASNHQRSIQASKCHFLNCRGFPRKKGVIEKGRGAVRGNLYLRRCASAREKAAGKFAARHENCLGAEKYLTLIACIPIITW